MIKTTLVDRFESVSDLARYLDTTPRAPGAGNSAERNSASAGWDFDFGLRGMLDCARTGGSWQQGADQIVRARIEIERASATARAVEPVRRVAGHSPCVQSYLAGIPEAMWAADDESPTRKGRVLRVGVMSLCSAGCSAESVMYRGAAALGCIDQLEAEGYRIELVTIVASMRGKVARHWDVVVKQAQDDYSPAAVAFALAHPGFSRRLGFRLMETDRASNKVTESSYGSMTDLCRFDPAGFDVFIPSFSVTDASQCETAEGAAAYMGGIFQQGLDAYIKRVTADLESQYGKDSDADMREAA